MATTVKSLLPSNMVSPSNCSNMNVTTDVPGTLSIDNLYPAIVECFVIILAGYIAGRADLINPSQGKGIGTFVGKFCLPALLFKSMVELNFSRVNWYFLLGIAISKTSVFVIVLGLSLLIRRPMHLGFAGLFAIFATQSNDFALGYPIIKALYSSSHPEYLQYIYLIAPISLVFLNPIGFTLLEIQRQKEDTTHQRGTCRVVLHVVKDVLSNPIVFMVFVGIGGNFLFKQKVPDVLEGILDVLGNAFSATALFYLGLNLVGKVQGQLGVGLITPLLLIGAKSLLLPLITWQVVGALAHHDYEVNNTRSLSMYGFLYGTFPSAPSVFLYANHFSIAQDVIATGMVVSTFLSAPLMFVSAKMMTVVVNSEMDYKSMLMGTSFDLSVISIICNTLACIGMIIYDGMDTDVVWQHYTQFVILLVGVLSTRSFSAVLAVVLYLLRCRSLCYVLRMKFWLYMFGIGFPVLCTGMLLLLGSHHLHDEIDPSFHYGIDQAILSVVVLSICSIINITFLVLHQRNSRISREHKGIKVRSRSKAGNGKINTSSIDEDEEKLLPEDTDTSSSATRTTSKTKLLSEADGGGDNNRYRSLSCAGCTEDCEVNLYKHTVRQNSTSIEDIVPFPEDMQVKKVNHQVTHDACCTNNEQETIPRTESNASSASTDSLTETIESNECRSGTCSYQQRRQCAGLLRCYNASNRTIQTQVRDVVDTEVKVRHPKPADDYQTGRFLILLLVMQISMFMGLFLCTWRLFNDVKSGIYVEIEFLDSFFNYGQSLVVFAIFGFDTKLMILPCIRRWRKWMYGIEFVNIPPKTELTDAEKHVCDQFVKYHQENCQQDIVRDLKYKFRTYSKVFCGTSFCDWLIEVGLCRDRSEAVKYGKTLLRGQVIRHVTEEHDFHDMPYFYRFIEAEEELPE